MARRAAYPTVVLSLGKTSDGASWVVRELKTDASAIEDPLTDVAFIDAETSTPEEHTAAAFSAMLERDRPRLIGFRLFAILDATRGDVDWKSDVDRLTTILEHCKTKIQKGSIRHKTRCTLFVLTVDEKEAQTEWKKVTIPEGAFINCVQFTTRHVARELTTHQQRTTCFNVVRMLLGESFGGLQTEQTLMPDIGHIQSWTVWMLTDEYEERRKKVQYRLAREEARYLRDAAIPKQIEDPFNHNPVADFCQKWADRDSLQKPAHEAYKTTIEAMQDAAEKIGRKMADPYNRPDNDWNKWENLLRVPKWKFTQVEMLKKARILRNLGHYGAARVVEPWTTKPASKPTDPNFPPHHNIHLEEPDHETVMTVHRFSPAKTLAGIKTLRIATGQYSAKIEHANDNLEHNAVARRQQHNHRYPVKSEQKLVGRFGSFQQEALLALASRPLRSAVGRIAYPITMLIGLVAAFPLADLFRAWNAPNPPLPGMGGIGDVLLYGRDWPLYLVTKTLHIMLTEPGVYLSVPLLVTLGLAIIVRMLVQRAEQDLQNLFGPGGRAERVFVHSVLELPATDRPNLSTLGRVRNELDDEIDHQVALIAGSQRRQLHLYRARLSEVERRLIWLEQDGLSQHRTPGEAEADHSGTSREAGTVTLNFVRPPGASQNNWSLVPIADQPTHTQLVGPWPDAEEKQDITFMPQGWPPELDIRDIDKIDAYMLYPETFLERVQGEANKVVKPNVKETALSGNLGSSQTEGLNITRFVLMNPSGRLKEQLQKLKSEVGRPVWGTPDDDDNKRKETPLNIGDEGRLFLIHQTQAVKFGPESNS